MVLLFLVTILKMSAKVATLDLKIKVFWNKGYGIIVFVHDINKILSLDSNYIVDKAM